MFRKLFVLTLVALATSGCATIQMPDGSNQQFVLYQVGVVVRVVNNCAPLIDLERVGGIVALSLPYGDSITVPIVSQPFTGNNRRMSLIAKGYSVDREYLGSVVREFYVNTYEGSREEVWVINRVDLPNRRGGCQ